MNAVMVKNFDAERTDASVTENKMCRGDGGAVGTCVGAVNVHANVTNRLMYQHNAR